MPTAKKSQISSKYITYSVIGVVIVLGLLLVSDLTLLHSWTNPTPDDTMPTANSDYPATSTLPAAEPTDPGTSSASDGFTNDSPVTEAILEQEITGLMTAFGIPDLPSEDVDREEPYDVTDVEALSLANTDQKAPPAGIYQATALFSDGVEKDLEAFEAQGRSILITADGAGQAQVDFFGLKFTATYDDHYLYLEDGSQIPYYYDGNVITGAAHRMELDLVKID